MSMGDSGIEKRSSTTAQPYINVTPLIDVLLVLLILYYPVGTLIIENIDDQRNASAIAPIGLG